MTFKEIYNRYNNADDIKFVDWQLFQSRIKEDMSITDLSIALSDLYHVEVDIISTLSAHQLDLITLKLKNITSRKIELITRFKMDGVEYGFIPNFSEITTAELIDMDNFLMLNNMPALLSVLYRPIVKKQWNPFGILGKTRYEIEPLTKLREEEFKEIPLSIAKSALDFFLSSSN